MTELILKLRENKGLLLIISAFLILFFVFILDARRLRDPDSGRVQTPIIVRPGDEEDGPERPESFVSLVRTEPAQGVQISTLDSFDTVRFEFSKPVDHTTAQVTVFPKVEYTVLSVEDNPAVIDVIPRGRGWEPFVEYHIEVLAIQGVDGSRLDRRVRYTYKNTPPDPRDVVLPY